MSSQVMVTHLLLTTWLLYRHNQRTQDAPQPHVFSRAHTGHPKPSHVHAPTQLFSQAPPPADLAIRPNTDWQEEQHNAFT